MRNRYFTKEGIEVLDKRIKELIIIFNRSDFPINQKMWGFPKLNIKSKEECEGRIRELCDIIGAEYTKKTEISKIGNKEIQKEVINY